MVALALHLKFTCHILIHGEKRQKGKTILGSMRSDHAKVRAAPVCVFAMRLCVCLCEWCSKLSICSISEGLGDVISHSVLVFIKWPSHHGSPTKASPFPARAWRVTGQLERGAVITALRRQEPGRGRRTPAEAPTRSISKQTWWTLEVTSAPRTPYLHSRITCGTCHGAGLTEAGQTSPPREETSDVSVQNPGSCWRSSSPANTNAT